MFEILHSLPHPDSEDGNLITGRYYVMKAISNYTND